MQTLRYRLQRHFLRFPDTMAGPVLPHFKSYLIENIALYLINGKYCITHLKAIRPFSVNFGKMPFFSIGKLSAK